MTESFIKNLFETFPQNVKLNKYGEDLQYMIDHLFIGATAPVFSQADTSGRVVSLRDFRGKYVLIDFWASWCVHCRADNPYLVKAIEKYKDKNFAILGVSLDTRKDLWLEAIRQDGLNWTHISDLSKFNNEVSLKYNVDAIPNNFLVDPNGRIVANNLGAESMLIMLDQLVK